MNIPSPRKLNLKRFERPDFRSTTARGKHAQDWTWKRAMYRLRSWLARARRNTVNDVLAAVQPLSRALRALQAHHPVWSRGPKPVDLMELAKTMSAAEQVTIFQWGMGAKRRAPGALRRMIRQVGRRSAPVRRHRLEDLSSLPHKTYMSALDARQRYVIANLLKLKGLAAQRAFGETTWKEARHADRYATA